MAPSRDSPAPPEPRDAAAAWFDARGLQRDFKEHAGRGIGTYVASLVRGFDAVARPGAVRPFVEAGADLVERPPRSPLLLAPAFPRGRGRLASQLRQQVVLAAWIARGRPALVHFASQTDAPWGVAVPSVVTVHDVVLHGAEARPEAPGVAAALRFAVARAIERRAIARAARLVVPSSTSAAELARTLGVARDRIAVVPEAAAPSFGPAAEPADEAVRRRLGLPARYLLHPGGADRRKRLPELVAAFDRLASDDREVALVLSGPTDRGPGAASLRRAIEAAASRDRIRAVGVLASADMPALYRGAQAVVLATRHEGFGLPVVEAFASGVPVVATAASAIAEVAGDAAILVPVDEPAALADAVRRLLRDQALSREMRVRGLARAASLDEPAVALATLRVLEQASGAILAALPD
jgi:glycosyltransferase involved in cell wall biosynthesis